MAIKTSWVKLYVLCFSFFLLNVAVKSAATENQTAEISKNVSGSNNSSISEIKLPSDGVAVSDATPVAAASETIATTAIPPTITTASVVDVDADRKADINLPHVHTIPDFIRKMMIRFGEAKAAEAFQSLDQLPLGLVMKILLVEMDKNLASDIVEMQRYAQSSDKALITMIGRIVAGDKNVPKEIFVMDLKLMKFPWWMRIRERMLNNLEKYIAAYSLVPVAAKSAVSGASKPVRGLETPDHLSSELSAAVAASATESSNKAIEQVAAAEPAGGNSNLDLDSLKLSLLNPLQQQQLLGALALSKAASASSAQAQNLLQQTQQATNFNLNPFLLG